MWAARIVTTLVLTAHGSKDPRSAANARAVAALVSRMRPGLDVRLAFCEWNTPRLVDLLDDLSRRRGALRAPRAVVTPLLLANAYHARVDIPAQIAASGAAERGLRVTQSDVLGEDARLVSLLRARVTESGVSRFDETTGVLVVAIGSSDRAANARTAGVAPQVLTGTRWAGAATAFVTGPEADLDQAADRLRRQGAGRLVIAPWFLAPGRLPDRVAEFARAESAESIDMAAPLGAHRLLGETVLDRFDQVTAAAVAA
jgi:sirohydrochlorin ferrochelatase